MPVGRSRVFSFRIFAFRGSREAYDGFLLKFLTCKPQNADGTLAFREFNFSPFEVWIGSKCPRPESQDPSNSR